MIKQAVFEIYNVKEKLPEYDFDCLVYFNNQQAVYVGYYLNGKWILRGSDFESIAPIEFWGKFPNFSELKNVK